MPSLPMAVLPGALSDWLSRVLVVPELVSTCRLTYALEEVNPHLRVHLQVYIQLTNQVARLDGGIL